jgi:hypothetical protein
MCLTFRKVKISKEEVKALIKTVKKKKTVYKIFRFKKDGDKIRLYAPFQSNFEYHLGQQYTSKMDIREGYFGASVEAGLHSFQRKNRYMRGLDRHTDCILIPCIIPAGGRYLTGTDNEIVSDKLVLPDSFIYKGEEYNINY